MGDNVYLGDRDSVRTPMQWNADRNGGFSTGDPQRMSLPLITDAQHHYVAVNVEAQRRNPSSLWWWMRRMIALRQQHPVFARGSMQMIESDNPKVLTFLRSLDGDSADAPDDVLVVANLSRHPQQVNVPLAGFEGTVPIELNSRNALAPVESTPYRLMIGPYDVYWLQLRRDASPGRHVARDRRRAGDPRRADQAAAQPLRLGAAGPCPAAVHRPPAVVRRSGPDTSPTPPSSTRSRWRPAPTAARRRGASACRWSSTAASRSRYISVLRRADGEWHDAFTDPTFAGAAGPDDPARRVDPRRPGHRCAASPSSGCGSTAPTFTSRADRR